MPSASVQLGSGIYSLPEALSILKSTGEPVTARQLRYWLDYGLATEYATGEDGRSMIRFADLISVEVIRRFRAQHVSLQSVRLLHAALVDEFEYADPFAYNVFYTDGAAIWAQIGGETDKVIELVGGRRGHYAWTNAVRSFSQKLDWGDDRQAKSWRLTRWVAIDPEVQFGTPIVRGTRVPVHSIEASLKAGNERDVANWYALSLSAVRGVREYLLQAA